MKIKEFEALTLKDCLGQVRSELGPEAVILETRKMKKGGILGWGARDAVRIVAGTGITVHEKDDCGYGDRRAEARRAGSAPTDAPADGSVKTAERAARNRSTLGPARGSEVGETSPGATARKSPDMAAFLAHHAAATVEQPVRSSERVADKELSDTKLVQLESEMREIKAVLKTIASPRAVVEPISALTGVGGSVAATQFPELLQRLLDADVHEDLAMDLLRELPECGRWAPEIRFPMTIQALTDAMSARIRVSGPLDLSGPGPKVVALVGPTGVGKTTTIAKIAAHYALVQKRRVGLITLDTYRIAAVEQLRSFSQIIGIPVEVVHDRREISLALGKLSECDLVLIDTAGRSQKDAMQVNELKALVQEAGCETHLVLAASTRQRDMDDQIERFSVIGVDRLIFSKLDETTSYGTLFNAANRTRLPISFFTAGQKVPEDLEVATARGLVERIMNAD